MEEEQKILKQDQKELKKIKLQGLKSGLMKEKHISESGSYLIQTIACDPSEFSQLAQELSVEGSIDLIFLVNSNQFCIKLSKNLIDKKLKASGLVSTMKEELGCQGGGKEDFAQGKISSPEKLLLVKSKILDWMETK